MSFGTVPTEGVEFALWHFRRMLFRVNASALDCVLFGSVVMYLHGLREAESVGDVDVFVRRGAWGRLFALGDEYAVVETPRAGDPPFLTVGIGTPIHVFYAWTTRDEWMNVAECFARAETRNMIWPCIPLDLLARHKRMAETNNLSPEKREKHERDLSLIEEHLAT